MPRKYLNKPCPICGGIASFTDYSTENGKEIAIECENYKCGLQLFGESEEQLIALWNRRAHQPRINLKTCPLCGAAAKFNYDYEDTDANGNAWVFIECSECGLNTRGGYATDRNVDYFVNVWNGQVQETGCKE